MRRDSMLGRRQTTSLIWAVYYLFEWLGWCYHFDNSVYIGSFWRKGQRLHEFRRNWMWRKQLHSYLSNYEAWDMFQTMNEVWPQDCGHCLWLQLLAIAASLWLPHSRCNPVSPASNGHQGSYGVVLEEVTRGYVGLPQQNTPSPFCTSLTPAKHLSVICKPLFWGISCQLIWVSFQKWLPWYLSTTLSQSRKVLRPKSLIFFFFKYTLSWNCTIWNR